MVLVTDSWLPLPIEEYQNIQNSLIQYAYNDSGSYIGHALNFTGGLLGFIVNLLVLAVILRSKNIRSSNSGILSFQMAFCELTRALMNIATPVVFFIKGQTTTSPETCFINSQYGAVTSGVWLLTLALSALDRYLTIVRQTSLSKLHLGLLMALTWIMTFIFSILPVFAQHQSYYKVRVSGLYCGLSFYDHTQTGIFLSVAGIIYMGLPNQAISTCYSAIIKVYVAARIQSGRFTIDGKEITDPSKLTLWQTYKLIKDIGQNSTMTYGIRSNTSLGKLEKSLNGAAQLSTRQRLELLVFRKSVTAFVIFNIGWLPITITMIYELITGVQVSRFVDAFDTLCMTYNGFVNSYLNFVLDERFKAGLNDMFGIKN